MLCCEVSRGCLQIDSWQFPMKTWIWLVDTGFGTAATLSPFQACVLDKHAGIGSGWNQWYAWTFQPPILNRSLATEKTGTNSLKAMEKQGGGNSNIFYSSPTWGDDSNCLTRWWQLKYVWNVHPENWGRWTHFDEHIFQRGWFNHQLGNGWLGWSFSFWTWRFFSVCELLTVIQSIVVFCWKFEIRGG